MESDRVQRRLRQLILAPICIFALMISACGVVISPAVSSGVTVISDEPRPAVELPVSVITSTSILADWISNVGGDRAIVVSLLPLNSDPHTFRPGARDVSRLSQADLVFRVGLNLEGKWMNDMIDNSSSDTSKIVSLGDFVDPRRFEGNGETGEADGTVDPHFWFDPLRVEVAVRLIVKKLSQVDPEGVAVYEANGQAYLRKLEMLHEWTVAQVDQVPSEKRLMVTSHDSFGYFADRYGLSIVGAIIPGSTTDIDPTAQDMIRLIESMKTLRVQAIFTETSVSSRLAKRIAEEAGVDVISSLYSGSLGPSGSEADTYIGMMKANVNTIVEALR